MPTDIPPLTYGNFYHIYNRGNNHENIFRQERNYAYFLALWWKHISPIAQTWAYCLLRNHFHAAVYIKNKEDASTGSARSLSGLKDPSQYFSNFFNAYARGFNIACQRTGALFERPFKRIPINSTAYLMQLIVYVHQNPQKHRFAEDFRAWKYSSYHLLTSDIPARLQREGVMQLFGSREDFVRIHQEIQPFTGLEDEE
jgi:putative transposase